ncbi:MAG: hypothetical protein JNL04_21370 [Rhodospirillaceae bacterium]|jgi:hypothetical protein|nr:hypothetical protein [Rhodospirillaceae bacterium]
MYTDDDLETLVGDIDRTLESNSAWLTPRSRGSLLLARDVVERVMDRRRMPWPALMMDAAD